MKKFLLLVGVGVGFVLGSKTGHGPYERLDRAVRELSGRRRVKHAVDTVTDKAEDFKESAVNAATAKFSEARGKVSAKTSAMSSADSRDDL
jgi:hypothetical protein